MKKYAAKSKDIIDTMNHGQAIECRNIEAVREEIPKAKNRLVRTVLQALDFEAEKHHLIQQMIIDSIKEESVNLSPDELQNFSHLLNKHLEAEEKALSFAKEAYEKSNLPIPRFLLSYLVADLEMQNDLLSQFENELKTASISTSVSSRILSAAGTA